MEFQSLFLTPLFLFYFIFSGGLIVSAMEMHGPKYTKLFVFGDSYSATGNNPKPETISWKEPYGITYPGKPSGRFSNGRVLTDFIAKHIGVKSPLPYTFRKVNKNKQFKDGVNFAYGGTGVMDTFAKVPNMTTQINFFRRLIKHDVFTAGDLSSSIALVTLAGNDYTTFRATMPYSKDWKAFIPKVVDQLVVDLKRIADLGVKKILVTNLEPIGCLPETTAMISYKMCYNSSNSLVESHNLALSQAVSKLYYEYKNSSSFIILDLNTAFTFVLQNVKPHNESTKFENPLKPCCVGVGHGNRCGSVDKNGAKKYTVCENPDSAFFWDNVHPTEKGWESIYQSLEATFTQLNY